MKNDGTLSIFRSSWMILAIVIIASVLVSTNWYYYRITKDQLDNEFGVRLESVASLVSSRISEDIFNTTEGPLPGVISKDTEDILRELAGRYSLSNILVLREDGTIVFSLNSYLFLPGDRFPMWNMDYSEIIKALEGEATSTALYRSPGGEYMKAGYAPLSSKGGPSEFAVTVEASPTFLKSLGEMREILTVITLFSAAGIILFIVFVLKATGALIRARESLMRSETLATMGRMAAGIAHEIRNPLFIIRSSAEHLKETHPEESEDINLFIIEEVDRLDAALSEYLSFSLDRKIQKHEVDLIEIVEKSIKLVRKSMEATGVEIVTNFEIGAAPFEGEEKRLLQSFINILINSIQALEGDGKIEVYLSRHERNYRLMFTDNGPGIPEKKISKVFEPFYTTKSAGSGLGLSIVKKTIEAHNGTVSIESGKNSVTAVTIELPCRKANQFGDNHE